MKDYNTYTDVLDLAVIAPTTQAFDLEFSGGVDTMDETFDETFHISSGVITLSRGNGSKYIVIISQSPITELPQDGVTYLEDYIFPDGALVLARGTLTSISLPSLASGDWYARAFEFNGHQGIEQYNRDTANNNPISFTI